MADELGLSPEALASTEFVRFFSGDYEAMKVGKESLAVCEPPQAPCPCAAF